MLRRARWKQVAVVLIVALLAAGCLALVLHGLPNLQGWRQAVGPESIAVLVSLSLLVALTGVRRQAPSGGGSCPTRADPDPRSPVSRAPLKVGANAFYLAERDAVALEEIARRMGLTTEQLLDIVVSSFDQIDETTRAHCVWAVLRNGDEE